MDSSKTFIRTCALLKGFQNSVILIIGGEEFFIIWMRRSNQSIILSISVNGVFNNFRSTKSMKVVGGIRGLSEIFIAGLSPRVLKRLSWLGDSECQFA